MTGDNQLPMGLLRHLLTNPNLFWRDLGIAIAARDWLWEMWSPVNDECSWAGRAQLARLAPPLCELMHASADLVEVRATGARSQNSVAMREG